MLDFTPSPTYYGILKYGKITKQAVQLNESHLVKQEAQLMLTTGSTRL